jgi:ParB family chromosome partitioning protein
VIEEIAIARVFMRKDARKIDEAAVRRLVDSIGELGIINPLRVRAAVRMVNGVEGEAFETIAGNHRLKAAIKAGLETVPCIVVDDDDLRAELAMIDENLMRNELKGVEKDDAFRRRKEIYEELHPETRHGGDRRSDQVATVATCSERFTAATAKAIGASERTVQASVERAEKICEEAKELIKGTELDTVRFGNELKGVSQDKQVSMVRRRLADIAKRKAEECEDKQARRSESIARAKTRRECDEANAARAVENFPHETLEAFVADLFGAGHASLAEEIKKRIGPSVMDRVA